MTDYYDYVLALIPGTLLGVAAALSLFGFPLEAALSGGGAMSALVVGHAVFVNGPVDEEPVLDAPARTPPVQQAD
jgi:hypothetical protein